jgi:P-type Cu2+ transporter
MTGLTLAEPIARAAIKKACAHCAEPLPGLAVDAKFCCPGCASAHAIISAAGLGSFYRRLEEARAHRPTPLDTDFAGFAQEVERGVFALDLLVDGLDCAACVWLIESLLARNADILAARVNLSTRRLAIRWRGTATAANDHAGLVAALGYRPAHWRAFEAAARDDAETRDLMRSLAVAGFAAANVMLLSVAVWSGHDGSMGDATRALFHWLSAAVALPAIAYAGRPFFRSAWNVLKNGRSNMDVPISIGVILASAVSLHETSIGAEHAFFDSAVTLLFFLLIGRTLDRRARGRARRTVQALLTLAGSSAHVVNPDGTTTARRVDMLAPGDELLVAAGERLGADGTVIQGISSLDGALINGESLPVAVSAGTRVVAGMINLGAPIKVKVTASGERTVLAEIVRLVEAAEHGRSRFVALADRVARAYAPVVHLTALLTFLGWVTVGGLAWDRALVIAAAVLIITCPCALALAVPFVQVVATTQLMKSGVLLLSPTALERLARIDHVVFDKTGTLTLGRPELIAPADREALAFAASLAANSRHPLAKALSRMMPEIAAIDGVVEHPGLGLQQGEARLGSARFCGIVDPPEDGRAELWLTRPGRAPVRFAFADRLRPDARAVIEALKQRDISVELLSGDRAHAVTGIAAEIGIDTWRAGASPAEKAERLAALGRIGRRVLMVGDGLNDAPALAAAHASISPATASEATQNAADAVFQGESLAAVPEILDVAYRAERTMRQNLAVALLYNLAAVPLAIAGAVTPLIAAVAMSSSSLLVMGNALRLGIRTRR